MKSFIVVALFAASVASQSMDMWSSSRHERRVPSTVGDLLMKGGRWGHHGLNGWSNMDLENTPNTYDTTYTYTYTIEELFSHPLFKEYMNLPLFSQMWEDHPIIFRRYLESSVFQKFWTMPTFQMYFRNPVLFYKYIVPQIQMFQVQSTQHGPIHTTEGGYPTVQKHNGFLPYAYSPRHTFNFNNDWTTPFAKQYNTNTNSIVYQKYLLEKMMRQMQMQMHSIKPTMNTVTDVKILPNGQIKEQTWGKIVNPVSGEEKIMVGDIKTVENKIVPRDVPFQFADSSVLLKHLILHKILGDKMIHPSVYEKIFGDVIPSEVYRQKNLIRIPEMINTIWGREDLHKMITPEIAEILAKINFNKQLEPEHLESYFGKKIYTPEIYETVFADVDSTEAHAPYYLRNKMINPILTRMMMNKEQIQLPQWKKDMLNKIEMIDEIKKEKMEGLLHQNLFAAKDNTNAIELEEVLPRTERFHKVPLTFTKPMVGSGIEEFQMQKDMF